MNGQMEGYKPAREDVNAPDMYIPGNLKKIFSQSLIIVVMSFVTYVLLIGVLMGQEEK